MFIDKKLFEDFFDELSDEVTDDLKDDVSDEISYDVRFSFDTDYLYSSYDVNDRIEFNFEENINKLKVILNSMLFVQSYKLVRVSLLDYSVYDRKYYYHDINLDVFKTNIDFFKDFLSKNKIKNDYILHDYLSGHFRFDYDIILKKVSLNKFMNTMTSVVPKIKKIGFNMYINDYDHNDLNDYLFIEGFSINRYDRIEKFYNYIFNEDEHIDVIKRTDNIIKRFNISDIKLPERYETENGPVTLKMGDYEIKRYIYEKEHNRPVTANILAINIHVDLNECRGKRLYNADDMLNLCKSIFSQISVNIKKEINIVILLRMKTVPNRNDNKNLENVKWTPKKEEDAYCTISNAKKKGRYDINNFYRFKDKNNYDDMYVALVDKNNCLGNQKFMFSYHQEWMKLFVNETIF